jgi:hypothetical protein
VIRLVVDVSGAKNLDKVLSRMISYLNDLKPEGKRIQRLVPSLVTRRFSDLTSLLQNNPSWAKAKKGKPVGVYTGRLKRALGGGPGSVNYLINKHGRGFDIRFGVNEHEFEHNYPKHFGKWFSERLGVSLVDLNKDQAKQIASIFFSDVIRNISRISRTKG